MSADDPAAGEGEAPASWREMAVARSLDPARVRAEARVQRFLDAALELMAEDPDKEFTVQEVVERSGQSLRSFYQYFAGKYELLLALFEESVRTTAEVLRTKVDEETEPLARLQRFVTAYYDLCRPAPKGKPPKKAPNQVPAPVMAEFAQQLLTDHPKEASRAYVPLMSLLEELMDEAAAAGKLREGLRHRQIAGIVIQAISFTAFSLTISGTPVRDDRDAAAEAWDMVFLGIRA